MKERPILFNDEMVRAILDGRKTQTRRPVKPQPGHEYYLSLGPTGRGWVWSDGQAGNPCEPHCCHEMESPFGVAGDRLWVRECWAIGTSWAECDYRATNERGYAGKWTPSIHMPRSASRLNLLVKRVWVERVRDISEEDAKAEGVYVHNTDHVYGWTTDDDNTIHTYAKWAFGSLWDGIYASKGYGWDDNPWVWCCEFEVVA